MKRNAKIEFGDFQTPLALAQEVCSLLVQQGIEADAVLEPTCGVGAFLVGAAGAFPGARLLGWDINPEYVEQAKAALKQAGAAKRAVVGAQDFFAHDWEAELAGIRGSILVLGNLPWVTNATVSGMNGSNLPAKENFQGFRGIEARTGKSNFDISEWMLIRLVKALRGRPATIAMLCKTGTARKLLRFAWQNDGRIAAASLYRIDAKKHFGASVDACLLLATTGEAGPAEAKVFDSLSAKRASTTLGLAGQDLVFDIRTYRRLKHLEGLCPYQWRSGVKHDCASVMELRRSNGRGLENKLGERVSIEPDYLFPLLKCSDLANGRLEPERFVVVTQRRVGEDTSVIAKKAPRTWRYLDSHRGLFEARKSSIYSSRMPFAIFGIGDYAFAPWKVAVSGLHRTPRFSLIGPLDDKPVLFDDTCYFIPFEDEHEARVVAEILNSEECKEFLTSLTFTDSKRPITVELLQRLNIRALAEDCGLAGEWAASRNRGVHYAEHPGSMQAEFVMERPVGKQR
ncbi:MAG TPA: class I SAM-dependent methyltransferase [Candidatus Paceibacterota bacterium]|nr:class I SAM-dependent methyltransferase [Candidatus Paceibacterota bacterium]